MPFAKTYNPKEHEPNIYKLWESGSAFTPEYRGSKETYSIVVPPPNANGDLHLGHGLTLALEDIAVRYHRMKGKASLLLPGADHAGFETQAVYEKELAKKGKSRFDFSREELYQQIWDFVALNRENYESQFRKLGASVDWSRYTFTLDDKIVQQAYKTFKKMWDDNLIYRGERLVNYCTFHGTGFADIEVEYKEVKANLWHISYPLTDGSDSIEVATTRPETMLGDTAIAVHPEDKRYNKLTGKTVTLPLTKREIPIIADTMVDQTFGSGAVKITPAHDPNDYDVAQRHDLPMISVIGVDGTMTHEAGESYRGLSVREARKKVVNELSESGSVIKIEQHLHSVGHCYKCGTVIEPLLREQWFINMQPLAEPAINALETNKITFYPESKKSQLITYLKGLRDWNISRQIAWGIPIPAFQNINEPQDWIFDTNVKQEIIEKGGKTYHRDPDVFDTWFSSSSWPYATLDYPTGKDFKSFYPLSVMETAADILYPWVSRMIMFGLYNTGTIPFKSVYLHGLIQDEHGAKMSKSKGNVIDPMTKIDEFGSDAFRMGIVADEAAGNNRPYDESKLIGARNFCNKLWNIARYIDDKLGETYSQQPPKPTNIADYWVLDILQQSTEKISSSLATYRFAEAYDTLYHTVWDSVADWYVESSKANFNPSVMAFVLETILKLSHPFAPFVSEAIWQQLSWRSQSVLATASWPQINKVTQRSKVTEFDDVRDIVNEIRQLRQDFNAQKPSLSFKDSSFFDNNAETIKSLASLRSINPTKKESRGVKLINTSHTCWLEMPQENVDLLLKTIKDTVAQHEQRQATLKKRLANPSYSQNAPKHIVEQTKQDLHETVSAINELKEQQKRFS